MPISRSLLLLAVGAVAGVAFVLSCGSESPQTSDAATTCDCPAAEPPLAGRIVSVANTATIASGETGSQGASCPAGAIVLGGSCLSDDEGAVPDITLQQSGTYPESAAWLCQWHNNSPDPVVMRVAVTCLKPAQ